MHTDRLFGKARGFACVNMHQYLCVPAHARAEVPATQRERTSTASDMSRISDLTPDEEDGTDLVSSDGRVRPR